MSKHRAQKSACAGEASPGNLWALPEHVWTAVFCPVLVGRLNELTRTLLNQAILSCMNAFVALLRTLSNTWLLRRSGWLPLGCAVLLLRLTSAEAQNFRITDFQVDAHGRAH